MSVEAVIQRLRKLDGTEVLIGIQGQPAAGQHSVGELATIAMRHEYGVGVPIRPFMRTSLSTHSKSWAKRLRRVAAAFANGDRSAASRELRRLGLKAVGDVQATIRDHDWTPNSPATIAAKGSDKPLIDTGQMRQSIRAAVAVHGTTIEVIA